MNIVYLASRYSRRLELVEYAKQLNQIGGVKVQARWLDGSHQITDSGTPIGDKGENLVEDGEDSPEARALTEKFALDDYDDVMSSQYVFCFTEPPRTGPARGGRHVEMGLALANGARVIVVGHRENIFCYLPFILFASTWEEAKFLFIADLKNTNGYL